MHSLFPEPDAVFAVEAARASVWHRAVPTLPGERLGVIGHYAAPDAASGAAVLARACAELAAAGCTLAVGPMDRDTWHSYRLVTEQGTAPPFFLEPSHPPDWPAHWAAAGFTALAGYHSTVTDRLDAANDPRQSEAARRARAGGFSLRTLNPSCWDDELRRIHRVAAVSFRANFLYTPLPEPGFLELYRRLRGVARPELVLLAEDPAGRTVGFLLGLLDPDGRTFIIKTVAVLPGRAHGGLGRRLVDAAHEAARNLGCQRAVHALIHDGNASRHLSARYGSRLLRRYTLFSRRLP